MTKYTVKPTTQFKKAQKQHLNLDILKDVVSLLADGKQLPPEYHDHSLSGKWKGHRECHLQPDWLLIYRYEEDVLVLTLTRTGSHADLFGL